MIRAALGLLLLAIPALSASAQESYEGRTIASVAVEGLERVSEQAVASKIEVQAGAAFNARAVARDIRRLYELGYFTQIRAEAAPEGAGVALKYVVEEKRVIGDLKLVGNRKLRERRLLGVLTMREGDSFVAEAFGEERSALLKEYAKRGYANATVDVAAEKIGPSRVGITYFIDEGPRARIRTVRFEGNEALSRRQLRRLMKTKRAFWFIGGRLEEEKLDADLEKVVGEYGNFGHLEAAITKVDTVFTRGGRGIDLTIGVSEGPVYTVADMDVDGNVVFDPDEVTGIIEVQAGEVHNKGQVLEDATLIAKGYQDSGYVNAEVTPQVVLDRERKTTSVVHQVAEGDLKYVREITVTGNSTTKDEVIRAEVELEPGERFDGSGLEDSRRNLENTRFFEKVRLTLEDDRQNDLYTNLLVDVDEGKTGLFNFGAGFNSETGIGGFAEVKLSNFDITNWKTFSGGGQQLRLRGSVGTQESSYVFSFTDPDLLGYPLSFGYDLYKETTEFKGGTDYTEDVFGSQVRFGKRLSENLSVRWGLGFENTKLNEVVEWERIAHPDLRDQEGSSLTVSLQGALERNTLDRNFDPATGSKHTLSGQLAGLGDNYFVKLEQDSIWFWPLSDDRKWVLSYQARGGMVTAYGSSDSVPIQDRLYAGGTNSVRGYELRDLGPQAREYELFGIKFGDKFRQGGNWRALSNLEVKYKVTDIFRVYGFWDAGGVWEYFDDFSVASIKHGVGIGLGFDVPRFGPIRLDYGFAVNPDGDQGSGQLHFSSGFRF